MSKYIDAEKLTKAIEDKGLDCSFALKMERLDTLALIDELQQEQPTKGYDEAYLNDCIAKASKTWEGVDVDKYMDEVRGREQEQEVDLEEEIEDYFHGYWPGTMGFTPLAIIRLARHFYELGLNARKEE